MTLYKFHEVIQALLIFKHITSKNGANFIVADADSSESESDNDNDEENMLIPGENLEHMQIPVENLDTHLHEYTCLTSFLDIVPDECAQITENLQQDMQIYRFKIYFT